ncbi:unnamed protein product [Ranitomeya imitator]|uniref:ribonuclease H n=1 Tax=Ranitomeya imitator TaxID=111125 RepID=A0ABN9KZS1_9NEOB|nr:unnamed protein product [Ranitomeya imitator]
MACSACLQVQAGTLMGGHLQHPHLAAIGLELELGSSFGPGVRNTVRLQVDTSDLQKNDILYVGHPIIEEMAGISLKELYCVQEAKKIGQYDVTFNEQGTCLLFYECLRKNCSNAVLKNVSFHPLFELEDKALFVYVYNPFTPVSVIQTFLSNYCVYVKGGLKQTSALNIVRKPPPSRLSAEMERKMYNLSKQLDVEEVTNMLLDDRDLTLNEDLGEESEIDSHDEVEECVLDSETEQDGDSGEDEEVGSYYIGKDKNTKWNKKPFQKKPCFIGFSRLLEALRRGGTTSVPLVDIWVVQDTGVAMDIKGLSSCVDQLTARVQNIQDFVVQNSLLEPRIPIPDLFFGDRTKFLSFKNNCKLFLALKPRSSGDPIQQVRIVISFLRGDPQDWAFSLASGDPALSNIDAFFLALGLLYDEPNSVDQAEKNLLALCQAQDEIEVYCQKFRKWSVLTQWNESALAAIFRKGLSEALKDVTVGFPMPAGLNESMSLAIQIGRRLREHKPVHHLAVLPELKPEPMQCDRTLTRVERQEHRRLNGLCFYCGDSTHAISDCPKRTKRFARSATIGTVQSKFLLSVTLICSLSSYSVMAFVDSGAALNLMDLEYAKRCGFFLEPLQCPIPLRGIDATPLAKNKPQYWTQLTMCMAPAHQEVIRFLVLHNLHDVVVLGLPWLQAHNPVLDWKFMSVSSWGCQGVHGDVPFLSISSSTPSEVPEFLSDYRDVFDEPKSNTLPPHRDCDCAINLIPGSKFPKCRLFNLSVPEHTAMRSYVKESLEKGHIRPSSSPLGAGFFFVAKKDGSLRPCIDYRLLNKITVKFQYPLPLLSDLFARIKGASWFTKIDLRGAYYLVRIKQGDEWKTAFNTPEGHFEYLVMPFGLANAPSVFQSFMHDIFREYLDKFLIVYLDDILIFSDDWESHVKQVRTVFSGPAC